MIKMSKRLAIFVHFFEYSWYNYKGILQQGVIT